jgi:hypothetical protein
VDIKVRGGATFPNIAVGDTGAFTTSISAKAGDTLEIVATDHEGLRSETVVIAVPFGATTTTSITPEMSGPAAFHARIVASEGTKLVVSDTQWTSPFQNNASPSLLVFDASNAAAPQFLRRIDLEGRVWAVTIHRGVVYAATSGGLAFVDTGAGRTRASGERRLCLGRHPRGCVERQGRGPPLL